MRERADGAQSRRQRLLAALAERRNESALVTDDGTSAPPVTVAGQQATPAAPPADHAGRRRQAVAALLTLAVLAIVFVGIFPRFADYGDAVTTIQRMPTPWVVALVATTIASIGVYVWPFQAALPGLTYPHGFIVRQTSFTISNTVPAGGAIGLGVQYGMLTSYGYPHDASTAAIAATSVFNAFAMLLLPVLGVGAAVVTGEVTSAMVLAAGVGLAAVAGGVVVLVLVLRSERTARAIGRFVNRVDTRVRGLLHRHGELHADDALAAFRASTAGVISSRWRSLTATNLLQQLSQFAILYAAVAGVTAGGNGSEVTVLGAFVAFAFARLASFVPITPNGLGTVDAALTALLTTAGASSTEALAAVLVWRAASFVPQVLIGVVTFLVWRHHHGRRLRPAT